jgi:hypothetical protein
VVAAANLDVALACMVFMMSTFVEAIDLWGIVADPGRPLRDARRLTSQMPRGDIFARAREIVAEPEEALIERNRVTHSVPVHPESRDGLATLHPRNLLDGEARYAPMPTFQELLALADRIKSVAAEGFEWIHAYADYRNAGEIRD